MKTSRLAGTMCACVSLFTSAQALSVTIDTYFGWNFNAANITDTNGNPITLANLNLNSIDYIGGSGPTTQAMPFFSGYGSGMPDGQGFVDNPTYTTVLNGDGETTRTVSATLPIDWIPAGVTTPWGATYAFPTIGITGITAFGVQGSLTTVPQYVVGLIPLGPNTELASSLGGFQSDIYDASRLVSFTTDPASGFLGSGTFVFSAASAVPLPAALWLFGSGLLGLVGIARRKKASQ